MRRCLFCEFAEKKEKCRIAYEDENIFAFYDWNEYRAVHVIAFPKKHIGLNKRNSKEFEEQRRLLVDSIPHIASVVQIREGYELVTEEEEVHIPQNMEHLHFHMAGDKEY